MSGDDKYEIAMRVLHEYLESDTRMYNLYEKILQEGNAFNMTKYYLGQAEEYRIRAKTLKKLASNITAAIHIKEMQEES